MTDIIDRLTEYNSDWRNRANSSKEVAEAIDEIGRLREVLQGAQRIIERDFPNGQLAIDIRNALAPVSRC